MTLELSQLAKYNLVKNIKSESEANMLGDRNKKSSEFFNLSDSTPELQFKMDNVMAPSAKPYQSLCSSQEDLWKSILPDYNCLMDNDLIYQCQETMKELHHVPLNAFKSPESVKSSQMLTYQEFVERFNNLHDSLHCLQENQEEITDTRSRQICTESQLLKDQATLLKLMNPELKEDINRRSTILTNKLNLLEKILQPKKARARDKAYENTRSQLKETRKWLKNVDERLRKLKFPDIPLLLGVHETLNQIKTLQREIESRGSDVTALVRHCSSLDDATKSHSKLRRFATILERNWHNLWLRSLEIQCMAEKQLQATEENQTRQEYSDIEPDEGPVTKHRRLSLDRWTTAGRRPPKMNVEPRLTRRDAPLLTKDVGVHCSDVVSVNDKCIMVGTTGIAALKAEYGDDFTNFEIIQDVGYSSESSTHLSSDDGCDVIHVYDYGGKKLIDDYDGKKSIDCDDSGLGTSLAESTSMAVIHEFVDKDEEEDLLETVLECCPDLCEDAKGLLLCRDVLVEDVESCDESDGFQTKSSFTSSSQKFYMISVDSENDETETHLTDSNGEDNFSSSIPSSSLEDDPTHSPTKHSKPSNSSGSVETVLASRREYMLPPPMFKTPSCLRSGRCTSMSKICSSNEMVLKGGRDVFKANSMDDLKLMQTVGLLLADTKSTTRSHYDHQHQLSNSLPSILCPDSSAEDSKGAHSRRIPDESLNSGHSKCSEQKRTRRRSKRKSSGSNRSSRRSLASGDSDSRRSLSYFNGNPRQTRRRHFSQKCDSFGSRANVFSDDDGHFLEMTLQHEDNTELTLKDELEMALAVENRSLALLSPTLTHLEEQSTVSDQVWDGYQDLPYLSEGYSEATVDEEAVRKLTEFGDDYVAAIGHPIVPTADVIQKSPHRKTSRCLRLSSGDSDSDVEDLHHVLNDSEDALRSVRATLKTRQSGDFFSSTKNAELLATCETSLVCLLTISEQIDNGGKTLSFLPDDLKRLDYLIGEFQKVQRNIEMYEETDTLVQQRFDKTRQTIEALFNKISGFSSAASVNVDEIKSWKSLKENISKLQTHLFSILRAEDDLKSASLQVHRFITEHQSYKDSDLKDRVTDLYLEWGEVYKQNDTKLKELKTLKSKWDSLNQKVKSLSETTSEETLDLLQAGDSVNLKDLEDWKQELSFLQSRLPGIAHWKLESEWQELESRIQQKTGTTSLSTSCAVASTSDDSDDQLQDALARTKKSKPGKFGRLWSIFRMALPIQITLVLLFCLACYMEPKCCDRVNNLSLSLVPQLKCLNGPPPV